MSRVMRSQNTQGARHRPANVAGMQLDVFRHSDKSQAEAYRKAAETALVDPFWTEAQREARARYYTEQAERLEQSLP